jgi:hypothetical protein
MPNLTKFQESWLRKTDSAGNQVKQWCRADNTSPHKAFCMLCCKSIQCSNSGFKQLLHHAEGKRHSDLAVARFGKTQKHLEKGAIPDHRVAVHLYTMKHLHQVHQHLHQVHQHLHQVHHM